MRGGGVGGRACNTFKSLPSTGLILRTSSLVTLYWEGVTLYTGGGEVG